MLRVASAMINPSTFATVLLPTMLLTTIAGCGGSVASQLPSIDPAQNASKAMELYDANGDGKLVRDELRECPSLVFAMQRIDQNSDGAIAADELVARFEALDTHSDIKVLDLTVSLKRKPLGGANITFTPEPFMGEGLQSYSGMTSEQGRCELVGSEVDLYGLPVGYYKVDIVHQGHGINATRGVEVADDAPAGNRLEIAL
ncbi:MAG TPA: hypothetical protein VJ828_03025 [Lacipirellulaceae bacterium]|nr:hypothetical protein [Lacipirellulaceae bacterium]